MRQKIEKKMRNKWKWKGHFDRISSSSVLTMTSPFSKCRIFSNFPITLCRFFYFVCCCVLSRRSGSPQTNHHIYHCEKNSRSYRRRREYTKHGVLHARRRGNRVWWQRSAQCIHTDIHIRGMRMCVHSAVWSEAHMLYYVIYALPVWCTHASNNCWPSARTKQKIIIKKKTAALCIVLLLFTFLTNSSGTHRLHVESCTGSVNCLLKSIQLYSHRFFSHCGYDEMVRWLAWAFSFSLLHVSRSHSATSK